VQVNVNCSSSQIVFPYTHILPSASSSYLYIARHSAVPLGNCKYVSRNYPLALLHCWRDVISYESLKEYCLTMLPVAKVICIDKAYIDMCVYIYIYIYINPRKPINSEKPPSYFQLVHHKSYVDRPGIEPGSSKCLTALCLAGFNYNLDSPLSGTNFDNCCS
jgi:hypothetical protein